MIKDFTDLIAWQKGYTLARDIYSATTGLPKHEAYGLSSQIRRAAISITSNIAEGFERRSLKEKIQFNYIALGSLSEVQSQLFVAKGLNYIDPESFHDLYSRSIELAKIIHGLNNHLNKRVASSN